jgi:histidyl-tRNA synthetase
VGVEVLGVDDPHLDAEVIALADEFYKRLGLRKVELSINSLGDAGDRQRYAEALQSYFSSHAGSLSEESRATLAKNPLRVLDSKRAEDQGVIEGAPRIEQFLSSSAAEHFEEVKRALAGLGVSFVVNERLVRGLDYYRRTTFEFISTALTAAHTAIGGGGRYDGLVEELGGPATAGIGFALGLDRTLLACDAEGVFPAPDGNVSVFVVDTTGGSHATRLCRILRGSGISADRAFDGRSMKAQMKAADRSGAAIALIIGTNEVESGSIVMRSLSSGEQTTIADGDAVVAVRQLLANQGS